MERWLFVPTAYPDAKYLISSEVFISENRSDLIIKRTKIFAESFNKDELIYMTTGREVFFGL